MPAPARYSPDALNAVGLGNELLKQARDLFISAGASQAADKTRAAIISGTGARQYIERLQKLRSNDE